MTTPTTSSTETREWDRHLTSRAERTAFGKALRSKAPRSSHAAWVPNPGRPDPISLLEEANKTRLKHLVPIRFRRMATSPFAFYRGSADIMAHDLSKTPVSGISAQICGDAHLSNFGMYASPERRQVFDINDFDETLSGPWEWDVKRLAASIVLAGRQNGYSAQDNKQTVLKCIRRYREQMQQFAEMNHLDVWYFHIDVETLITQASRKKVKQGLERASEQASKRTRIEIFPKLAEAMEGQYRIKDEPPLVFHYSQRDTEQDNLGTEQVRAFVLDYLASLPLERRILINRYRPLDLAHKVVGVGSVGTFCAVVLALGGSAIALVTATGRTTAFGDIAASLASKPPQTEFERGMAGFSLLIVRTVFFLVLFIFLVGVIAHHRPLETILFAISLAVGLTPEGLPAVTTITLSVGAQRMAKKKVIVKYLESIENFGSIDTFCSDKTGTLTSGDTQLQAYLDLSHQASDRVLLFGNLNCAYDTGIKSPLDDAILQYGKVETSGYSKVGEIPFDFNRRRLSVIVQHGDQLLLITKGAPESVLPFCSTYELHDVNKPLDDTARANFVRMYQDLNTQGYRALAVAYRPVPQAAHYSVTDEQNMVLLGFLTFADPPKPDATQVLQALKNDGVQVKILTGDNELVTRNVCEQVGLDGSRIVLGSELDQMTDEALARVVEQVQVFARVSPRQKNRIILALKNRQHVVGYMGDGINDAPSLHTADVGISVSTGVDVAKDAAAIILLEKSLQVLHEGILEGRKAFGNVMKYLLMATSSNFGNMFSMAGAYVFLPFLPMLPSQILLNNLLYDTSQMAIPSDNVAASFMKKPQHWNIGLIRNCMIFIGPLSSIFDFLTFFLMLRVFHAGPVLFHTGWFVESLCTQTLIVFVIRTTGNPLRSRPSRTLTITVLLIVAIGILLPYTPLAGPLGFTPLPGLYFLFLIAMTIAYLVLVGLVKRPLMRQYAG